MEKHYVWGFPGIGKSSVSSELRIADADCEPFKFIVSKAVFDNPHLKENADCTQRNPAYPGNYWDYVHSVDADIVLLNCHISLLEGLDKEKLMLVYPSADLKEEYLRRYTLRGENRSYIHYMETAHTENMK